MLLANFQAVTGNGAELKAGKVEGSLARIARAPSRNQTGLALDERLLTTYSPAGTMIVPKSSGSASAAASNASVSSVSPSPTAPKALTLTRPCSASRSAVMLTP
jgi:hypothetical protein